MACTDHTPCPSHSPSPTFFLTALYKLWFSKLQKETLVLLVLLVIDYPDLYHFAGVKEEEEEEK